MVKELIVPGYGGYERDLETRERVEPLLLLWKSRLDSADGSSVQLRRMLGELEVPLLHIHSDRTLAGPVGRRTYFPLCVWLEPPLSLKMGAGALKRLWKRRILPWTCRIAAQRGRRKFRHGLPSTAYVIVHNEDHARLSLLLLKALGITRYIVHFMDLLHDGGISGLDGGNLEALVRGACLVRVINPRLRSEFSRWRTDGVEEAQLLGVGNVLAPIIARRSPILLMMGTVYSENKSRLRFLREVFAPAWRRFKLAYPGPAKWVYCGQSYHMLPPDVARDVENLGFLDDDQFSELLRSAQCGILPIEHSPHDRWRFSVPSRLVDFLTGGLPFIAPPNTGTATGDFLAANTGRGVRIVLDEADCFAALNQMFNDPEWHSAQCGAALNAARQFDPAAGADRFKDVLAGLDEK